MTEVSERREDARGTGISRRGLFAATAALGVGALGASTLSGCGDGSNGPVSVTTEPVTVPVGQVPVGGAVIVGQAVVSQPTQGQFRAFSAVCTHERCLISRVHEDSVECTCHGSIFSTLDGAVMRGPASRPLPARPVTVDGDNLTVT